MVRKVSGSRQAGLSRNALEVIVGGAEIGAVTITAPVLRHSYNRWGATAAEASSALPGDDLVPRPKITSTRAITVGAPPDEVWAWVVQIGQGRGGFYSFDALENLIRCDIHSADRIITQLQELHAGDLILLAPAEAPCFRVATVEPPRCAARRGRRADPSGPSRDAAGQKLAERGRLCRAEYLPNVPGGWDRRLLFAPGPPTILGGGR